MVDGGAPGSPDLPSRSYPIRRSRRVRAAGLALVCAWGVVVAVGFWGFSYDDAFITYRYARSWEERGALEFNRGETVYGTTAPGYAVALGSLARLVPGVEVPEWGTVLAVASLAVLTMLLSGAVTAGLRQGPESPDLSGAVPVAFGLAMLALRWTVELFGAESLPALALVGLGVWQLFGRSRQVAGGLLLAAAAMIRLDAGLAACALGCAYWAERRRFPVRLALAGALPLTLYGVSLVATFGRLVPSTLQVKQSELLLPSQGSGSYGLAEWRWLLRSLPLPWALLLLGLALVGLGWLARSGLLRRPLVLGLGAWIVGHEVVYRVLDVPFAPWYELYTLTAVVALAAFGIRSTVALVLQVGRIESPERRTAVGTVLFVLILAGLLVPSAGWLARQWGRPPDPRWEIYHEVAAWLVEHAPPPEEDSTIASVEVGFLGYSSRRPVLDLLGLVSPGVTEARQQGRLPELVAARSPRYLLDVPWLRPTGLGALLEHPSIAAAYAPVARFPVKDGPAVRLLERRVVRDGPALR